LVIACTYFLVVFCDTNSILQCDIADTQREVQHGEGEFLARSFGCPFFETSAKLRINIDNAFHELVRQIKKWQPDQDKAGDDNQNSKSGCCVLL